MAKRFFHFWGPWIYDKASCTSTRTCTKADCDYCRETKEVHDFEEWEFIQSDTCIQYRKCSVCRKTETRDVDHDFNDWKYHSKNSCEQKRTCRHCGYSEFRIAHEITEASSIGNECLVESRCNRCGEIIQLRERHNWSDHILPYKDCLSRSIDYLEEKKQILADIIPTYAKDPLNPKYVELSTEYLSLPSKLQQYKDRMCMADPDDLGVFCTRCKKPQYLGRKEHRSKNKKGFLSYSWDDKPYANRIDDSLREDGIYITRDIRDLDIGTNLHEFMNRVEASEYVIVILSDSYLKSENCMYEAIKIVSALIKKECLLLPIVIDLDISKKQVQEKYVQYWLEKVEESKRSNDSIHDCVICQEILGSITEFLTMVVSCKYEEVTSLDDINEALFQKIKGKIKAIE